MNAIASVMSQWRKKFALTICMFIGGSAHAFLFEWSAGELTALYGMLLGIFGAADLADNGAYSRIGKAKEDA